MQRVLLVKRQALNNVIGIAFRVDFLKGNIVEVAEMGLEELLFDVLGDVDLVCQLVEEGLHGIVNYIWIQKLKFTQQK